MLFTMMFSLAGTLKIFDLRQPIHATLFRTSRHELELFAETFISTVGSI